MSDVSSVPIVRRIARIDRCSRDLAVPSGMPSVARHLRQRHPEEVVHHDDGPPFRIEVGERLVEGVAVDDRPRRSRRPTGIVDRGQVDLDRAVPATAQDVDAGVDDESAEPRVEAVGIAKTAQVAPCAEESFLDRVVREIRDPEGSSGPLRPAARRPPGRAPRRRHDRPAAPARRGLAGPRQPLVTAGPSGRAQSVWRWRCVNRSRAHSAAWRRGGRVPGDGGGPPPGGTFRERRVARPGSCRRPMGQACDVPVGRVPEQLLEWVAVSHPSVGPGSRSRPGTIRLASGHPGPPPKERSLAWNPTVRSGVTPSSATMTGSQARPGESVGRGAPLDAEAPPVRRPAMERLVPGALQVADDADRRSHPRP